MVKKNAKTVREAARRKQVGNSVVEEFLGGAAQAPAGAPTIETFAAQALALLHKTLVERGASYGSFFENSTIAVSLAELMGAMSANSRMDLEAKIGDQLQRQFPVELVHLILNAQNLIAGKHSRLFATPLHKDSWLDIAGYAILVHAGISLVEQGHQP